MLRANPPISPFLRGTLRPISPLSKEGDNLSLLSAIRNLDLGDLGN